MKTDCHVAQRFKNPISLYLASKQRSGYSDLLPVATINAQKEKSTMYTKYLKLPNLRIVADKMAKESIWMYAFDFLFGEIQTYTFLFRIPEGKEDTFSISFVDKNDISRRLVCSISKEGIAASVSAIFRFFCIHNGFDGKDHMMQLINSLYTALNAALLTAGKPDTIQISVSQESSASSSEGGIYLCGLRRTGHRSEKNTAKAKRYCKDAFDIFGIDPGISFCFSADPAKQVSIRQLCERMARLRAL